MSTSTTQQMTTSITKSPSVTPQPELPTCTLATQEGLPIWARPMARAPDGMGEEMDIHGPDPELDRIEKCGPYLLCIRPPSPRTNKTYIIRLHHQDTKEVVISVVPPVDVYNVLYPNFPFQNFMGLCWWSVLEEDAFYVKYKGQLVCQWGGKNVVQQLPYERGPGAGVV